MTLLTHASGWSVAGFFLTNLTPKVQNPMMFDGILMYLRRLPGLGGVGGSRDAGIFVRRSETSRVRDPATGRVATYGDPSQLPSALREAPEKAKSGGQTGGQVRTETHREYGVVGPDGTLRTCTSLEEMPPQIRAMLGKKL